MANKTIPDSASTEQVQTLKALSSRIAFMEDRYKAFDSRLRQLQKNLLDHHQELRRLIGDLDREMIRAQDDIDEINDRMKTLRNEILLRASKEDIEALRRYMDTWEPLKWVTADQVEEIVRDILKKK
ncbi:hypothetical protein GF342_05940 [Candidatus Woesearchaeota archaeon]|nr:hypothetical protein [Candidatus Woesearchaeota archaeon]